LLLDFFSVNVALPDTQESIRAESFISCVR